jgi:hypothetical protein
VRPRTRSKDHVGEDIENKVQKKEHRYKRNTYGRKDKKGGSFGVREMEWIQGAYRRVEKNG